MVNTFDLPIVRSHFTFSGCSGQSDFIQPLPDCEDLFHARPVCCSADARLDPLRVLRDVHLCLRSLLRDRDPYAIRSRRFRRLFLELPVPPVLNQVHDLFTPVVPDVTPKPTHPVAPGLTPTHGPRTHSV